MRIIHVISNYRWTERVEPAADLVIGQQRLGHEVRYLCGRNRGVAPEDCVQGRAARKGLVYDDRFHLSKHLRLREAWEDILGLRQYMETFRPDVVHCHLPNAHLLAARALANLTPRPLLVRTFYESGGPQWPLRYWMLSRRPTDGLIVLNERTRQRARGRFHREPGRVEVLLPGIDIEAFSDRKDLGPLGVPALPENAFILGMVTAIGHRRRIDLVLEAVARLAARYPDLRLMICGRGKPGPVIHEPTRRLGITDRVILPGYCRNDDLIRAYRTMHALIYPQHGTDHSCRTVREALASGVPVIAADTGVTRELIKDGETGWVTAQHANALAEAVEQLLTMDPAARATMATRAAADARERFCRVRQAEKVIHFYKRLQHLRA